MAVFWPIIGQRDADNNTNANHLKFLMQAVNQEIEKLKDKLNLILIALLCSTTLAPVVIFYLRGNGKIKYLVLFIGLSYLFSRLSWKFYDRIQISTDLKLYRRLGVHHFKKLSTNGDLINKAIRKKYPKYRLVINRGTIKEKLKETYSVERAHTVLFIFCLMTTVYAWWIHSTGTAVILFIGNLLFNYYPILLQQYNRNRYRMALNNKTD